MIQYIRGELAVVEADRVIVDVGGVGYGIFMPVESISQLPPVGNEVRIYTYLNVKEDAMQLFGFLTRDDLQVFKLLIGVNGIGPKGGQAVLSVLSPDDLRFAVLSGDVKAICAAPGMISETGILKEKHATGYPGCKPEGGAIWSEDAAVVDVNLVTGKGPGAASEFAIAIIRYLEGDAKADQIRTSTMM